MEIISKVTMLNNPEKSYEETIFFTNDNETK